MLKDIDRIIVENVKTGEVIAQITEDEITTASDDIVVRMRPIYDTPDARLLTLEDLIAKGREENEICWFELRNCEAANRYVQPETNTWSFISSRHPLEKVFLWSFGNEVEEEIDLREYGSTWRCWTYKPTKEQRRETAWKTAITSECTLSADQIKCGVLRADKING